MARLNIEDSLYRDDRWLKLLLKVGCEYKAIGLIVRAWTLAQNNWLKHKSIPKSAWNEDLRVLIEVGLIDVLETGDYYVKGSHKNFAWLDQKSKAGQKGGKSKSEKKLKNLAQNKKIPKRMLNGAETALNGSKPPTLTLSLTPTLSHSLSTNSFSENFSQTTNLEDLGDPNIPEDASAKPRDTEDKLLNKKVWESYREAYLKRWSVEPTRNAKVNSQISQLVKRLGKQAVDVVSFYLTMNKPYYVEKMHQIGLCLNDAESVMGQYTLGKEINRDEIRAQEKASSIKRQWERMGDE